MTKIKYVCSLCGYESAKWYGRCPTCSNWNSFEEFSVSEKKSEYFEAEKENIKAEQISDVKNSLGQDRLKSGFEELDRTLGGGIVPGSVVLLSGDPGIGKSTLLLQVAVNIAKEQNKKVFYIAGEESSHQVKMRAVRLVPEKELAKIPLFIISSTNTAVIFEILQKEKPDFVIVDSIQTMETRGFPGFPGSIPQVRHATLSFISFAKKYNVPIFLVGHVTKEGIVAGPMLLAHMVDVLMYLEGEKLGGIRMVRAMKNRFGDSDEIGIFVMGEKGLSQVKDTSSFFIEKRDKKVSGSCIAVIMEGTRPMLVEVQALVVSSTSGFPRRVSLGISEKRIELILAIMQKHLRIPLERLDVFINVVGGVRVIENASDLAVCLAVWSSFKNKFFSDTVAISEIGLLGELRAVASLEKRINEAKKFGFGNILTKKEYSFLNQIIYDKN